LGSGKHLKQAIAFKLYRNYFQVFATLSLSPSDKMIIAMHFFCQYLLTYHIFKIGQLLKKLLGNY